MNLKNYTSTVPMSVSVARIEILLAEAGATVITKDYQQGVLCALIFTMPVLDRHVSIRLPANHEAAFEVLRRKVKRPTANALQRVREQALRTSWKLLSEWVEIQLSLIRMQRVETLQVFLPYVWDGKRTFYQAIKDNQFKALPSST